MMRRWLWAMVGVAIAVAVIGFRTDDQERHHRAEPPAAVGTSSTYGFTVRFLGGTSKTEVRLYAWPPHFAIAAFARMTYPDKAACERVMAHMLEQRLGLGQRLWESAKCVEEPSGQSERELQWELGMRRQNEPTMRLSKSPLNCATVPGPWCAPPTGWPGIFIGHDCAEDEQPLDGVASCFCS